MKTNVGTIDKVVRFFIAAVAAVLIATNIVSGAIAVVLGVLGAIMLFTGLFGMCPLYTLFGISTGKKPLKK
jgi:hypothetical protein